MKLEDWIHAVNVEMERLYTITIEDTGFTSKEFFDRYGFQRPLEAALTFGDDYDLDRGFW